MTRAQGSILMLWLRLSTALRAHRAGPRGPVQSGFDRLAEATNTAQELYDRMLELYPDRINPGWALWSSVRAVKSQPGPES